MRSQWTIFITAAVILFGGAAARGADTDTLVGKWSLTKTNESGQNITQSIEIKKDKFVFQISATTGALLIYAEGDIKLEKLGPFSVARFSNMRAGDAPSNLENVDEEYTSIYALDSDTWTLASNFDKQREQKPSVDIYYRVKAASKTPPK